MSNSMTNRNDHMELHRPWTEYTFVAFDTETSGAYPIGSEIIEFGAVKWKNGTEIATIQTLLKPKELLSEFNMSIHGISNEMVATAPKMPEKIREIYDFLSHAVLIAHHAPFDLGFLAVAIEENKLVLPAGPILCSSLLSRKIIHGCENHKLQTLVRYLNLDGGTAHRALDDARSCLKVGLECFKRLGDAVTLSELLKCQDKSLRWSDYSLLNGKNAIINALIDAIQKKKNVDLLYEKTATKAESRSVSPLGIVRNPDGDYLQAICLRDKIAKRYYLSKIREAIPLF